MLRKALLLLVVLVAALVAFVATRPAAFRVERSLVVRESPEALFGMVADFHRWADWSPWARLDPAMQATYGGVPGEVGATYHWKGNDTVGEGRMTVVEVHPPRQVRLRLEFLAPWRSTSETVFDLYPETGGTRVVWIMRGDLDFMGKAMCLVMDMDRVVGPDFERGLAALKKGAEDGTIPR